MNHNLIKLITGHERNHLIIITYKIIYNQPNLCLIIFTSKEMPWTKLCLEQNENQNQYIYSVPPTEYIYTFGITEYIYIFGAKPNTYTPDQRNI